MSEVESITLALSGGGFRATLFHLGVVRYLRESEQLRRVTRIVAVSGGSILAAHLALNWTKYTGDEEKHFQEAAREIINLCRSDLRGKVVRRRLLYLAIIALLFVVPISVALLEVPSLWAKLLFVLAWIGVVFGLASYFSRRISLIDLLVSGYGQFYRGPNNKHARLQDLAADGAPETYLLSTNLTSGRLAWFDSSGLTLRSNANDEIKYPNSLMPLAIAVASSSAFPPAFSPMRITQELLQTDTEKFQHPQFLADGGVFDNLGLSAIGMLPEQPNEIVIVSSAERRFDIEVNEAFSFLPTRAARASDVLMSRVSSLEMKAIVGDKQPTVIELRADLPEAYMAAPVQHVVRNLRTDLDRFSDVEIQLLCYYGYGAARHARTGQCERPVGVTFNENGIPIGSTGQFWLPVNSDSAEIGPASHETVSRGTRIRWGFWKWSDWKSWALLASVLATLFMSYPSLGLYKLRPRFPKQLSFERYRYDSFTSWDRLRQKPKMTGVPEKIIKYAWLESGTCKNGNTEKVIFIGKPFREAINGNSTTTFNILTVSRSTGVTLNDCVVFLVFGENTGIEEFRAGKATLNEKAAFQFSLPASNADVMPVVLFTCCNRTGRDLDLENDFAIITEPKVGGEK
jgi:predicted acylesterase/phospholipase RssA